MANDVDGSRDVNLSFVQDDYILDINSLCYDSVDEDVHIIKLCNSSYLTTDKIDDFLAGSNFNLLHVNCRSLQKNYDSLCSLVEYIKSPFIAIAVTETWLNPHNENFYSLQGFTLVSNSRLGKVESGVG